MEKEEIRILILESGFVIVCRCPDPAGYPFWLPYTEARMIRRYGTTEGLGQLCGGPTAQTVLEAMVPEGKCPVRAIINCIEGLDQVKWNKALAKGKA